MQSENGAALEELEKKPPGELAELAKKETEKAGGRKALISRFDIVDIEFVKPLEWCGKTYTEAHLDFTKLTGIDMEAIDDEMGDDRPTIPAYSRRYQKILAAKASSIPSDAIERLSAADYNAVTGAAQRFLMISA